MIGDCGMKCDHNVAGKSMFRLLKEVFDLNLKEAKVIKERKIEEAEGMTKNSGLFINIEEGMRRQ